MPQMTGLKASPFVDQQVVAEQVREAAVLSGRVARSPFGADAVEEAPAPGPLQRSHAPVLITPSPDAVADALALPKRPAPKRRR